MMRLKKILSKSKIIVQLNHIRKYLIKKVSALDYQGPLKINVGGGMVLRYGFKTLDHRIGYYKIPAFYVDYEYDLTSIMPFPIKDDTVQEVYTSHTLEHVPEEHWTFIFHNFYRILKVGGKIRIVVPDWDALKYPISTYDPQHPEDHVVKVTVAKIWEYLITAGFTNLGSTGPLKFETKELDTSINLEAHKT